MRLIVITGKLLSEYSSIWGSSASFGNSLFTSSTDCLTSTSALVMSYWISNSKITLVTPSELFVLICFIPSTLLRLFSRGFAINLAPSSGDAPSKKTVTLIKGNWILGLEEI